MMTHPATYEGVATPSCTGENVRAYIGIDSENHKPLAGPEAPNSSGEVSARFMGVEIGKSAK